MEALPIDCNFSEFLDYFSPETIGFRHNPSKRLGEIFLIHSDALARLRVELSRAIVSDRTDLVQLLVDYITDVLDYNSHITIAIQEDRLDILWLILQNGIGENNIGRKVFHLIAANHGPNREAIFDLLLRYYPEYLLSSTSKGRFPIHAACQNGNPKILLKLLHAIYTYHPDRFRSQLMVADKNDVAPIDLIPMEQRALAAVVNRMDGEWVLGGDVILIQSNEGNEACSECTRILRAVGADIDSYMGPSTRFTTAASARCSMDHWRLPCEYIPFLYNPILSEKILEIRQQVFFSGSLTKRLLVCIQ